MKRIAIALLLAGCGTTAPRDGRLLVLTTFQPLYSFAAAVAEGGGIDVVNLAPRAEGPHDFDFDTAEARALVRRADAVVTLRSLPLAERFDRLYPWCRRINIRIVEIDPAAVEPRLPLVTVPGSSAPNPHVWLSLSHAVPMVEAVARDFAALDPARAAVYRANAARYQGELRRLRAAAEAGLAAVEELSVVALTEGFPYLTADLGVEVVDYLLDGRDVEGRVRAAGVRVALAEGEPEPGIARAVERAGARVVVLSTLEEGWGEGDRLRPEGYLEGMRRNVDVLAGAFRR